MLAQRPVELGKLSLVEQPSLQDLGPQAAHQVEQDRAAGMADRRGVSVELDPDVDQASVANQVGDATAEARVRAVVLVDRDKDLAQPLLSCSYGDQSLHLGLGPVGRSVYASTWSFTFHAGSWRGGNPAL
jgi:hypothetical protein